MGSLLQRLFGKKSASKTHSAHSRSSVLSPSRSRPAPQYPETSKEAQVRSPLGGQSQTNRDDSAVKHEVERHVVQRGEQKLDERSSLNSGHQISGSPQTDLPQRSTSPQKEYSEDEWEVYSTDESVRYYQQLHGVNQTEALSPVPSNVSQSLEDSWVNEESSWTSDPLSDVIHYDSALSPHSSLSQDTHERYLSGSQEKRAPLLPETEVVSAIAPPLLLTGDHGVLPSTASHQLDHNSLRSNTQDRRSPSGADEHKVTPSTSYRKDELLSPLSTPSSRSKTPAAPPVFQWSREAHEPYSISQVLLPVAIPSLRSYSITELHEIDHLLTLEPSPERDQELWGSYERYLSFNPNHMEMWGEFSNFMIEVRGMEEASERIKEALDIVLDETPLLVLLTRMSCRMCDYVDRKSVV